MSRFIYVNCAECSRELGSMNNSVQYKLHNDLGCLEFECSKGHKNYVIVQNFDFEILLALAFESMGDEYYREAVFNFASALERCFEFAIELICFEKGIEPTKYKKFWDSIKNQSERQLGAFISLFLTRFGTTFILDEKMVKLRNSTIHKGRNTKEEEVREYGEYVLKEVQNIVAVLMLNVDKKVFSDFTFKKMNDKSVNFEPNSSVITVNMGIISFRTATDEELEQERKCSQYARTNAKHWAEMAMKANAAGKVLEVNEDGELVLAEQPDHFVRKPNEKYVGWQTLDQAILSHKRNKEHYIAAEKGLYQGIEVKKMNSNFIK